jgi:hypothetical protein
MSISGSAGSIGSPVSQPGAIGWFEAAHLFRLALATSLTLSALLFFLWTWRWPLIGDTSLMHYIGFLTERGWVPYRDLGDMNMPGSFVVELAAMHLFGMGDLAWRLFDFTLLAAASISFFVVVGRRDWLAGLFAASLFILVHGRDGIEQGGQRDLTMAVCLIAAAAALILALRGAVTSRGAPWLAAAFGLLSGIAVTIKPSILPLSLVQSVLAAWALCRDSNRPSDQRVTTRRMLLRYAFPAALAWLVAQSIVLIFLLREHALAAFIATLRDTVPYYASLGHRPVGYILLHSISPLLPLVVIWIVMLTLGPSFSQWSRDWERNILIAGVVFGLMNCIVQARALPYYRYPLLAFLLPLMGLDFTRVLGSEPAARSSLRTHATRALAVIGLCVGGFFLAPQSAVLIHRYRWWQTDFIASLKSNLDALGGQKLSGHIQCIDTNRGCGNVLYDMRLEPSTGVLSDFLLFGASDAPIIRQTREQFSRAVLANPPQVIVVSSRLYLDNLEDYRKLDRWPSFASFLADDYALQTQWWPTRTEHLWSREEMPAGYRIYVLRASPHTLALQP